MKNVVQNYNSNHRNMIKIEKTNEIKNIDFIVVLDLISFNSNKSIFRFHDTISKYLSKKQISTIIVKTNCPV